MNPKDYLDQIRKLRIQIEQRRRELERLDGQKLRSVAGIDYSRIPVKGSRRVGASFETAVIAGLDLRQEINALIADYEALQHRIIGQIQQLDRPEYIQLLYLRYVEERRWEDIAETMGYSCDHIRHMHGRALQVFGEAIKDNTQ